jgi:hypothetical protein
MCFLLKAQQGTPVSLDFCSALYNRAITNPGISLSIALVPSSFIRRDSGSIDLAISHDDLRRFGIRS